MLGRKILNKGKHFENKIQKSAKKGGACVAYHIRKKKGFLSIGSRRNTKKVEVTRKKVEVTRTLTENLFYSGIMFRKLKIRIVWAKNGVDRIKLEGRTWVISHWAAERER
jgi:hypothetical protein